jgi:methionine sulfoxide reductase heme-binding subunit
VSVSLWGFVAYLLLYAAVVTGITLSSPLVRRRLPAGARAGRVHESLSVAGVLAVVVHGFAGASPVQADRLLLLLFIGPGGRLGLGLALGVAGLYAAVVSAAAAYLRFRLGLPLWRVLHASAYPAFAVAAWHSVAIGANTWLPEVRVLFDVTLISATLLACGRVYEALMLRSSRPAPG